MVRKIKLGVLRLAALLGISRLLGASGWRRNRLLILCYHGVSRYDEHLWDNQYVSPEFLRRRLELIREEGCHVLALDEALERMKFGTLPHRSVVITFDDGVADFHSVAFPLLKSFGFPVTLYLTTYYVENQRPVFDAMCSYLLWKARDRKQFALPEMQDAPLSLDDGSRDATHAAIVKYANRRKLSGSDREEFLRRIASALGIDYEDLLRKRVLHLITPEDASDLAAHGVAIEFHTHRHRVYRNAQRMFAELEDNRRRIVEYTGREPHHFCYTAGFYLPEHPPMLQEYGMRSAVTCVAGLCSRDSDLMQLPRLVDTMAVTEPEFRAWLNGTAALLPKRALPVKDDQLLEDEA